MTLGIRLILWILSAIVPTAARPRWVEEWRAEVRHAGVRILPGALPDALALRAHAAGARGTRPSLFHALDQDVRYALRTFNAGKSFTSGVIGSLGIGIAATTTAFALVNATFLRPFPGLEEPDRLVRVRVGPPHRQLFYGTTWGEYRTIESSLTSIQGLAAAHQTRFAVSAGSGTDPRFVDGLIVSGNYFDVLGVRPALGRFFSPAEDDVPWARPAAVVSHAYWRRILGEDPAVLSRGLVVNGADLPIIGVAAEGFNGLFGGADVWTTFATSDLAFRDADGRPVHARSAEPFGAIFIGRLKPSATPDQAYAEAAVLGHAVASLAERGHKDAVLKVEPLRRSDPGRDSLQALGFMAVPLIVLAIACVNSANLLLARASRRSGDWLVRLALGASRWRLVRQLLVESLLLASGGAALGLLLCSWTMTIAQRELQVVMFARTLTLDTNVVSFTILAAIGTALLFGLGPALSVTRAAVSRAPEAGRFLRGPFGSRTRAALVVLQAGLCLGLLSTGAQFANTLRASLAKDGLPDAEQFLSASVDLDTLRYSRGAADLFFTRLRERIRELPMVRAASFANADVLSGGVGAEVRHRVWAGAEAEPRRGVLAMYAGGDLFGALGLPLLRGRPFSADELKGPLRAVIVNQPFAETLGEDPLGSVLRLAPGRDKAIPPVDAVIIGIVAAPQSRRTDSLPMVFHPVPLVPAGAVSLLVRFDGEPSAVIAALRSTIASLDDRVPLGRIYTGDELRRQRHTWEFTLVKAVTLLAGLALVLSAAGLYGVVSYMVMQRQKEIGIRMALGAEGSSVLTMILRQSIVPVLIGCVLGATGAAVAGLLIRSRLHGVSPVDAAAFAAAALLLVAAMVVASLAPARRATRVDPVQVLRRE